MNGKEGHRAAPLQWGRGALPLGLQDRPQSENVGLNKGEMLEFTHSPTVCIPWGGGEGFPFVGARYSILVREIRAAASL